MAIGNTLLYRQDFTGTTVTVTHNLDLRDVGYRVVCSGQSRSDLVQNMNLTEGDERNSFVINFESYNEGHVQVLGGDIYPTNLPSPENNVKLVNLPQASGITDSYVTGATLNSTTLELERNSGLADVTVDLAPILGPLKIINLTSTDTSSTFTRTSPLICPWDVETYKDAGFTHSNSVNNTRITIVDDGTYQIAASIRVYDATDQRAQTVAKILINGSALTQLFGSAYIRNSGNSSDYWSCVVNPPPIKLSAGDYVEVQIQGEAQNSTTFSSIFQGDESSFSVINLNGIKGSKGDSGSLTGNTGVYSDTFSGLTTTAVYYGDGSNLTGIAATFGSQYYSDETLAEADTTNTSSGGAQNPRADITTSSIPSGTYRIGWSLEWKASSQDYRWNGRVRVDDSTNIMEMASEPAKENKDEWRAIGGFGNQTFGSSGAHTVEMDWWSENSSGTAYIRKARIEFWRVS